MTIEGSEPIHIETATKMFYYVHASPEVGELTSISQGVYLLRMPMDLGLDHINVYLLEDYDGWYVVDTGLASDKVKSIWRNVVDNELGGKAIKGLICTHFHYDHASLAGWMMSTYGVSLYMSSGEYLWLSLLAESRNNRITRGLKPFYQQHGVPNELIDDILELIKHDPLSSLYPPTFNRIREGDVFRIGGRKWTVIMGEGHSPEHICLYDADDELLIAGDQLLPEISSSIFVNEIEPNANPLSGWLRSLNKLGDLPNSTQILPAHGGTFLGVKQRTSEIRALHQKRLNQLLSMLEQQDECSMYQLMRGLFTREMNAMNSMLALGETAAHVNYLLFAKTIEKKICTDRGVSTYRLSLANNSLT